MKQSSWGWFKWDFGLAGVAIYVTVIIVANWEKDWITIGYLVVRQATVTFFVTSTLMGFVLLHSKKQNAYLAYLWGAFFPASITAMSSFVAHWYFNQEIRNVVVPFLVSLALNSMAVTFARSGHTTFATQVRFVFRGFK